MRELLSLILVLGGLSVNAATYYLSPTGNDSNNGTSQSTPWRTIDRANQLSSSFQPGDRILFQRGGEYRGKLSILNSGNATAYIEVGAYGTGAQPILKGQRGRYGMDAPQRQHLEGALEPSHETSVRERRIARDRAVPQHRLVACGPRHQHQSHR
ncbi:MAG: hypothetical protein IPF41_10595 [Flavobacteriales bacterium]|nr:hypothetical protein [Flavobacteriales bacterium]